MYMMYHGLVRGTQVLLRATGETDTHSPLVRGTQVVHCGETGLFGDRSTRIQDLPESLCEPCPVEHSRKRIPQGKAEGKHTRKEFR